MVPQVTGVKSFEEAVKFAGQLDIRLIPYELAKGMDETREVLEGIRPGQSIGVFIGPEGGFEDKEIDMAVNNGILPVTLGKRILRTETAGMTLLAILMYLLEKQ